MVYYCCQQEEETSWKQKNRMDSLVFRRNLSDRMPSTWRLLQGFRLLDDDFMSKVFEDKECAQLLLHIILERSDLVVQEVHGQYSIKNLQGRSVRLDILAVDQEGKHYNIEIQRQDEGADARRARYNSSLLDANLTHPGDRYEELRETYVIFITERDVLKAGLPIYHIDLDDSGNRQTIRRRLPHHIRQCAVQKRYASGQADA